MKKVVVETAHVSSYPDPIGFKRGERVTVSGRDAEYTAWRRVTTADGNEGWAETQDGVCGWVPLKTVRER